MLEVTVIDEQQVIDFSDIELVEEVLQTVWRLEGESGEAEVNVVLVDDETMREYNRNYRGVDDTTDVLSFALEEQGPAEPAPFLSDEIRILGDILISLPRAVLQAEEYGHSFSREVGFLSAHGMLHLLGYDHLEEDERKKMREKEEKIMEEMKLGR